MWGGATPSQAELEYCVSQGMRIGNNVRIHSDYPFDSLFPWLISIGNNVCISGNVKILAHDTSTEYVCGCTKIGTVTIEDNVYIGYGSIILCGTRIGENAIIGAGSVVTSDVLENTVFAGNPARFICTVDEYRKKHEQAITNSSLYEGPWFMYREQSNETKQKMRDNLNDGIGYMK